ncbi:MAG: helix-turn-helix transcriptional regulator [Succiniclasticum sp.]|uniref:helix-turn-helix transcriptional regulator n=1 Tax=Succiniclasticum sp. TaxID=2775030 RepID=UPI002A9174DD|nr:helix-turn-helix transcriptional regulator [Succiniclasticum sp.]MDY6292146.1 helix-turn-helix transcriptional regulator [Succiniclasticum sp.]
MAIRIGLQIRKARKAKRLTQAYLADLLHVARGTVSRWETGKAMPQTGYILKMKELFNRTEHPEWPDWAQRTDAEYYQPDGCLTTGDEYPCVHCRYNRRGHSA